MQSEPQSPQKAEPQFSLAGVRAGMTIATPFLISSFLSGAVLGVTYRGLGFEFWHSVLLSALIFSGTAQAVTAKMLLMSPIPVLTMLLAMVGINARYFVMSAHLRREFPNISFWRMIPALFIMVDAGWVIAVTRFVDGRRDAGLLFGSGLVMYVGWVAGTAAGHGLGLSPTGAWAAGAAFLPLGFIVAILPSQWRGWPKLYPWLVTAAAAAALTLSGVMSGGWAALAGAAVGTALATWRDGHDD